MLTVEGIVENGLIRIRENVALPEHTKVFVVVPDMEATRPGHIRSPRLVHPEQAPDFAKQLIEISTDVEL
jgi:hypothetical protein